MVQKAQLKKKKSVLFSFLHGSFFFFSFHVGEKKKEVDRTKKIQLKRTILRRTDYYYLIAK